MQVKGARRVRNWDGFKMSLERGRPFHRVAAAPIEASLRASMLKEW